MSTTSVKRRVPKKKFCSDERFTITTIAPDGLPIEPLQTKDTFTALWNQPKKEELQVSFVEDRQKDGLWTALKENFTLPAEEDPDKPVIEPLVKAHALKKMEGLFRSWKNELKSMYVDKNKTPEFTGRFEKIRDHWPEFVAHNTSQKSKKMSV